MSLLTSQCMSKKPLALTSPKQRQGRRFEQLALCYLQNQGLSCIAQNWHQHKVGELDLVMLESGKNWDVLVFVEVRQRTVTATDSDFGDALMSITAAKRRKVINAARYFLQQHPEYGECECRFDVIVYTDANTAPQWIQGAFIT